MKTIFLKNIIRSLSLVVLSVPVLADDAKTFIGSQCSFADNPLASHHKIHHRLQNTSGVSQWVTCPLVKDNTGSGGNIEYATLDTVGTTSSVRLEMRSDLNGSLTGWNAYGSTNTGGSGRQHYWFNGSVSGNAASLSALAMEVYLGNNAYINSYRLVEN